MQRHITVRFTCLCLALAAAGTLHAADAPVTPYRPTVSSPAQLPAVGQLEFEAGLLGVRDDDAHRNSLPVLFKLAFSEQWGLLLGADAYVDQRDNEQHAHGFGDTNLILKRAVSIDDKTALGLEFGVKLPTAGSTIGSGRTDYSVNAIYSRDIGSLHLDANANLARLGEHEDHTGRVQRGLSTALAMPLSPQWSAVAELSGSQRDGVPATGQWLVGTTFSPSKTLTIDAGVAHGTTSASPSWSFFTGLVIPVAHLW
jgi:hypothetical protein